MPTCGGLVRIRRIYENTAGDSVNEDVQVDAQAVGPYINVGVGTYFNASNVESFSPSAHVWMSVGARFVLLPY